MNTELGKRLSTAREKRGLSLEEAAHATRMRPSQVQALEDGNLSNFPNAAYAKGFLTIYARFLGVEVKDVTKTIDTTTQMRVSDFQYLSNRSREDKERKREAEDTRYDFVVPEKDRSWTPLFILGGAALAGLAVFAVYINMSRIDDTATNNLEPAAGIPAITPEPPKAAPAPAPEPAPAAEVAANSEPEIPRPRVISTPDGTAPPAIPVEPEIPRAIPVSPIASMAADDAAALADITPDAPRAIPVKKDPVAQVPAPPVPAAQVAPPEPEIEEETSPLAADPRTIVLEPNRKAWIVIRTGPGGQPLYEDFLYPTAKPMRLPAGRYFIELKEADSVEITRGGQRIAYTAPGVLVE